MEEEQATIRIALTVTGHNTQRDTTVVVIEYDDMDTVQARDTLQKMLAEWATGWLRYGADIRIFKQ